MSHEAIIYKLRLNLDKNGFSSEVQHVFTLAWSKSFNISVESVKITNITEIFDSAIVITVVTVFNQEYAPPFSDLNSKLSNFFVNYQDVTSEGNYSGIPGNELSVELQSYSRSSSPTTLPTITPTFVFSPTPTLLSTLKPSTGDCSALFMSLILNGFNRSTFTSIPQNILRLSISQALDVHPSKTQIYNIMELSRWNISLNINVAMNYVESLSKIKERLSGTGGFFIVLSNTYNYTGYLSPNFVTVILSLGLSLAPVIAPTMSPVAPTPSVRPILVLTDTKYINTQVLLYAVGFNSTSFAPACQNILLLAFAQSLDVKLNQLSITNIVNISADEIKFLVEWNIVSYDAPSIPEISKDLNSFGTNLGLILENDSSCTTYSLPSFDMKLLNIRSNIISSLSPTTYPTPNYDTFLSQVDNSRNSQNLEYLYLLFLIIPMIFGIVYIAMRKNRRNNTYIVQLNSPFQRIDEEHHGLL